GLDDRGDTLLDKLQRLGNRQQGVAKGKAIVAQLRHQPSPKWSRIKAATAGGSPSGNNGNGTSNVSSEAMATTCGSSGNRSGLPTLGRCTSIFGCGSNLKPSTSNRSAGLILAINSSSGGSASPRSSCINAQRRDEATMTSFAPASR